MKKRSRKEKQARCRHRWAYKHALFGIKRKIVLRRCYICKQWQKGTMAWNDVETCPVNPVPNI